MTYEECNQILEALQMSNVTLLKAQEALELMWKGINAEDDCVVDNCPHTANNKYYQKARKLCKELGIEGDYCYHGEYHGE